MSRRIEKELRDLPIANKFDNLVTIDSGKGYEIEIELTTGIHLNVHMCTSNGAMITLKILENNVSKDGEVMTTLQNNWSPVSTISDIIEEVDKLIEQK